MATGLIHLGIPNDTRRPIAESVRIRNLNLCAVRPSDLYQFASVERAQRGYRHYRDSLPFFLYATAMQTPVEIRGVNAQLPNIDDKLLFPLVLPPIELHFDPDAVIPQVEGLMTSVRHYKGSSIHFIREATPAQIRALIGTATGLTEPATTSTSISGIEYKWLLWTWRLLSLFFHTHSYPAIRDRDHLAYVDTELEQSSSRKRPLYDTLVMFTH